MRNLFYLLLFFCLTSNAVDSSKGHFVLRGIVGIGDSKNAIIYSGESGKTNNFQVGSSLFSTKFKITEILKDRIFIQNDLGQSKTLRINAPSAISAQKAFEARKLSESRLQQRNTRTQIPKTKVHKRQDITKSPRNNQRVQKKIIDSNESALYNLKFETEEESSAVGSSSRKLTVKPANEELLENVTKSKEPELIFLDDDDDLVPPQTQNERPQTEDEATDNKTTKVETGPSTEDIINALKALSKKK